MNTNLKKANVNMTEGVIWKQLLYFAVPLILGDLFQQLYNTADSIIAGRFISRQALAAVSATGSIINILIGFFTGISTGATVVIARYYGASNQVGLRKSVHTTMLITLIMGALLTVFGVSMTPTMLRFLSTPEDVLPVATEYLRIYFAGFSGLVVYNMCAGILRAIGNSRYPTLLLMISALANIILDVLFVVLFKMGVAGAALATIISQFFSASALLIHLFRSREPYGVRFSELRLDWKTIFAILDIGIPIAIQKALVQFSNTLVVSHINYFGSAAMAGYGVYQKLDQIISRIIQSMSLSISAFVSQNVGASKDIRARKGIPCAALVGFIFITVLILPVIACRSTLISLFSTDQEVLQYGSIFLCSLMVFRWMGLVSSIQAGALRGFGRSKESTLILLLCYVVLRQAYLSIGWQFTKSVVFVVSCFPFSWGCCIVCLYVFQRRLERRGMLTRQV